MNEFSPIEEKENTDPTNLAIGLTIVNFLIWVITYYLGVIFIYGFVCPPIFIAAIGCCYRMVKNTKSTLSYVMLFLASIFFLLSLTPWFFPIARV